jgi:hypothetical protein
MARKINYEWVKDQFARSKTRVGVGKAVLQLLKTWETIEMDPEKSKQVLDIFSQVALGYALVPIATEEVWLDAKRGHLSVGDIVRVSHSAYDGELAYIHNGRRGVVVAIRSGDIIFNSTDDMLPKIEGAHYSPERLQKRVR